MSSDSLSAGFVSSLKTNRRINFKCFFFLSFLSFFSYHAPGHTIFPLEVTFRRKPQKITCWRSRANYYNHFSCTLQFSKVLTVETMNGSHQNETMEINQPSVMKKREWYNFYLSRYNDVTTHLSSALKGWSCSTNLSWATYICCFNGGYRKAFWLVNTSFIN